MLETRVVKKPQNPPMPSRVQYVCDVFDPQIPSLVTHLQFPMPEFHPAVLAYRVRFGGSFFIGAPSQPFHGYLIRSTTKVICAIAIIPRANGIPMNVEEAASVIKPATAQYVVSLADDDFLGMRNFERSLHVPVISIRDERVAHVWCLSPGNPKKPERINVASMDSIKVALTRVCRDFLVSRPMRIQYSSDVELENEFIYSKELELFRLIADSKFPLTLIKTIVDFRSSHNLESQEWKRLNNDSYEMTIRTRIMLYLLSSDFVIGFDTASFVEFYTHR